MLYGFIIAEFPYLSNIILPAILNKMKIAFFEVTEEEHKIYFREKLTDHELFFFDNPLTEDSIPQEKDFDVLSVFVNCSVTEKVIDAFPDLKLITARSTGFDNIDFKYAMQKKIVVSNVPQYGSHTVAEYTFALILSLARKIPQAVQRLKTTGEFSYENLRGIDIHNRTLGVIGTGKIGGNVIKIARSFGMKVYAFDLHQNEELSKELDFKYVDFDTLLSLSDIVTIHTVLNESTKHLINEENIFKMKKGAILINTARGGIISTDALFKAITTKHLSGAALDVLEDEEDLKEDLDIFAKEKHYSSELKTMLENHMLINLEEVIITPHMAFYTKEAEESIMQTTVENILAVLQNSPINTVN